MFLIAAFVFAGCFQHNEMKINFTETRAQNNTDLLPMHCFPQNHVINAPHILC